MYFFNKGREMKLFVSLIALIVFSTSLFAAPKFPFPQQATYKYGILPKSIDHARVQKAYATFIQLYKEEGDLARIQHDDPNNTVSEGIAYGMLVLVYMDNETNATQSKFDKLWNYYNKFLNVNGLMNWRISGFSTVSGNGAATDAELDAAVALLQAYKQWGDEKYLTDAKALLEKVAKFEVNANGYLKPGDSWDNEKNPSYFSTAALELYKEASSFDWGKVMVNSYSLIKKAQNSTSGLVPNWCSETGAPSGGERGTYTYDATRTPWRIAWAYSWYGHQDAKDICTKIADWVATTTAKDASKIVDGYQLNGTASGEWNNPTFVGPFVCAGMVDAKHQDWVDAGYAFLDKLGSDSYYQMSMKILTMLYLSGNMPNFWNYNPIAVNGSKVVSAAKTGAVSLKVVTAGTMPSSLSFTLAQKQRAKISLFNVAGKHIAAIANTSFAAGSHTVALGLLSAGSYLVKLETTSGSDIQRFVVAR